MIFLLGKHAMFGHAPPTYFRSIEAVRLPSLAMVHAINLPPVPAPSTRTSYFSGSLVAIIVSLEFALQTAQSFSEFVKLVNQLLRRVASNKNHVRRSVSSIHTSMKLAVATSRCSSHTLCASRRRAANVLLSSIHSASMSNGST